VLLAPVVEHPLLHLLPGVEVLFENRHVLVLSKPPGVLVHPVVGTPNKGAGSVTVCDALVASYGTENLSSLGSFPGIVHRLDRGTSGAMTVAKTNLAHALLVTCFFTRKTSKTYHALVHGLPTPLPAGDDPSSHEKEGGKAGAKQGFVRGLVCGASTVIRRGAIGV
jgi:23S rRNA pseudouridine1911/1915/1917 synthase